MELVSASTLHSLRALVQRAASQLTGAENAAGYLDTIDSASLAYDASKRAARMLKAKGAHDEVVAAVRRSQADALEIEAMASRRLADEYDAAQERGEVAGHGGARNFNVQPTDVEPTAADIGLTRQRIQEYREIRDAEVAEPGIVRRILDEAIEQGEEPTRTKLREAVHVRGTFGTGENEWYTPQRYIDSAREVLGEINLDPASNPIAQEKIRADVYYTKADNGLSKEWHGKVWLNPPYAQPDISNFVTKMVRERKSGRVSEAVMLTHNYTDTAWFHEAAGTADAICFTRGRIKFESPEGKTAAPTQGQAFFYFGKDTDTFADRFKEIGFVMRRIQ